MMNVNARDYVKSLMLTKEVPINVHRIPLACLYFLYISFLDSCNRITIGLYSTCSVGLGAGMVHLGFDNSPSLTLHLHFCSIFQPFVFYSSLFLLYLIFGLVVVFFLLYIYSYFSLFLSFSSYFFLYLTQPYLFFFLHHTLFCIPNFNYTSLL